MRKLLALLLIVATVFTFAACSAGYTDKGDNDKDEQNTGKDDDVTVKVAVLSGPTGMGIVKMIADTKDGKTDNKYVIDIFADPTEVIAKVKLGEYDIAALPTNVAAKLSNMQDVDVKMAAVNTLGVLYILEADGTTVNSIEDLRGKTIYANGQGSNPQYVLEYLLEQNGLVVGTDVNIVYEADADKVVAALTNKTTNVVMLPEPKVTATLKQLENVRVALDLTEEWDKIADYQLTQGCVVVQSKFAKEHKAQLDKFLDEYKASIEYVNANVDEAAQLVVDAGIIAKAPIAKLAIPGCKLTFIEGEEMKNAVAPFYAIMHKANPASIGGAVPDDDFYYSR